MNKSNGQLTWEFFQEGLQNTKQGPSHAMPIDIKAEIKKQQESSLEFDNDSFSLENELELHKTTSKNIKINTTKQIMQQTRPEIETDESENSIEEKETAVTRKERKSLPLVFDALSKIDNSDMSSSEDTSGVITGEKCTYMGERETLRSFWDKCMYDCFKSKRCVAGEKPKRNYRKKPKSLKPVAKKRKSLPRPLSCIDTSGMASVHNVDYLNRYEMLLYMDPLNGAVASWQKEDFERAFRMVKPSKVLNPVSVSDVLALKDDSTDYTNSDTDKE